MNIRGLINFPFFLVLLSVGPSLAAIPPLTQEELEQAPVILEGKITRIAKQKIGKAQWNKCIGEFRLVIRMQAKPKDEVVYGYLREYECKNDGRPDAMPLGDYGLRGTADLKRGDFVRVYASHGKNGERVILSPNGIQRIKSLK